MPNDTQKKFRTLKIAAITVIVLVIAVIAIPFLIDANQFRPQFESKLTESLGRDVKVGNLKLSILSGSFAVNDISIADNPLFSSSPFVTAESLKVGVELKPLIFSKEVRITGIVLNQPAINLIRSASGKWNFSDLGSTKTPPKKDTNGEISGLQDTDILIKKLEIIDGRVKSVEGHRKPVLYENVNLAASNLSLTTSFPFALSASLPGGGKLKLEGKSGPLNRAGMLMTPLEATLGVTNLDLVKSGFVSPDSGLSGLFDFNGTIASDGKKAEIKGTANAEKLQFAKGGTPAGAPVGLEYSLNYSLGEQGGNLSEAKIHCGKAIAHLSGNFGVVDGIVNINMKMAGTDMPVQELTPLLPAFGVVLPKGATLQGGSMTVNLTAEGPVDRLIAEGTADIANTRLAGYDLAGKMSALTTLSGIESSQLTEIEQFAVKMKLTPDGIQIRSMQMTMPALGELSGKGKIAADQSLNFSMRALLKPSGIVAVGLNKLTGKNAVDIPFFIRGTASDPQFIPDTSKAAGSILGSVLSGKEGKDGQSDNGSTLGDTLRGLLNKK